MSKWGSALGERFPDVYPRAISANSANSSELGPNGTNGTNGTGAEEPNLLPGKCAECGDLDDGTLSVVIMAMLQDKPWRHAQCYSRWIAAIGNEEATP